MIKAWRTPPLIFAMILVLLIPWLCLAQEQSSNTDQLRNKAEQLEAMKVASKSAAIQETYRQSLLSVYRDLQVALQDDIKSLEEMRSTVPVKDTVVHRKISDQIRALTDQWNGTIDKIRRVSGELDAARSVPSPSSGASLATAPRDGAGPMNGSADPPQRRDVTIITPTRAAPGNDGADLPTRTETPAPNVAAAPVATPPQEKPDAQKPVPFTFSKDQADKCLPQAPPILLGAIETVANTRVLDDNEDALAGQFPKIFAYSVLGGVSQEISKLDRYRYMGETARTDAQNGASAKSGGSTSAIEKPGFTDLLAWAIEHGAIQQQTSDSVLTLSTSPYAIITAAHGDTPTTYHDYSFFNRLGMSASFNISSSDPGLANARRQQLREWSVRLRLTGDRSTRSSEFADYWNKNVKPAIEQHLVTLSSTESLLNFDPLLRNLSDSVEAQITTEITAYMAKNPITDKTTAAERTQRAGEVGKVILCRLHDSVFIPLNQSGGPPKIELSPGIRARLPQIIRSFKEAQDAVNEARTSLKQYMDALEKKPLSTFAYTNQRSATGSDYSVFQFLLERKAFEPMKLVANTSLSFYHKPDPKLNQQKLRDLNLALSFEGKVRSPFVTLEDDMSNITYAFTGSYQRLLENKRIPGRRADLGVAQFKVELPVSMGFRLPFSITYASSTETSSRREVRANFGINLDAAKLLALKKLAALSLSK
jgi:hypothetical protein